MFNCPKKAVTTVLSYFDSELTDKKFVLQVYFHNIHLFNYILKIELFNSRHHLHVSILAHPAQIHYSFESIQENTQKV